VEHVWPCRVPKGEMQFVIIIFLRSCQSSASESNSLIVGRVATVLYKFKRKSAIGKQIITSKECKECGTCMAM